MLYLTWSLMEPQLRGPLPPLFSSGRTLLHKNSTNYIQLRSPPRLYAVRNGIVFLRSVTATVPLKLPFPPGIKTISGSEISNTSDPTYSSTSSSPCCSIKELSRPNKGYRDFRKYTTSQKWHKTNCYI